MSVNYVDDYAIFPRLGTFFAWGAKKWSDRLGAKNRRESDPLAHPSVRLWLLHQL